MLKKNLFFISTFLLLIFFSNLHSQKWVNISSNQPQAVEVKLISSDIKTSSFKISLKGFYLNSVITDKGEENIVSVEGATPILAAKEPDLPKISVPFIIPDLDNMEISIVSSSYIDFFDINIAPSKGNLYRDQNPETIPYIYGSSYSKNEFYPGYNTYIEEPYILRDFRAQTVKVFPFQYNPITKILRVYYDMELSLKSKNINGNNQFIRTKNTEKIDIDYNRIYEKRFLNYSVNKYTALQEQGKMLIICYDNFMNAMQPFVAWKNLIGIPTEIVAKSSVGTTATAIKNYVTNYYSTKGLTYLLLVGDASQIPTNSLSSGHSDNAYGYLTGNDKYQEIFVGRFSAETEAHVNTMVERTINYERYPNTTLGIYNTVMGIASSQGPGDDSEYDYQHVRNMQNQMINYTYTQKLELFEGSQGGNDASGDPTASMVTTGLNNGTGCIVYTGHGSETSFVTTGFSNTNINSLSNQNKLPFIWSVACVNGDFVSNTCFAETWLRAGSGTSTPKGAIATLMSTINQSWNPPMCGQDEMVDILTESYPSNIKRTFGGLSVNGFFKMNDEYTSQAYPMTDTWTIFGDPSLMVRTDDPATMNVSHVPSVILGSNSLQVNCDVDGAFVALTINNQIIGTATVAGGSANINFSALATTDSIYVAVTAFNYIPYTGGVSVIPASGPHINFKSYTINDQTGNNNSLADYNESISLNVTLENSGIADASGVSAIISTTDNYVNITKSVHSWGNIVAGTQLLQNESFDITISDNVPDQHIITFTIDIQDDASNTWTNNFNITINAPKLVVGNISVDDASGNNNSRLDPGENVTLDINTFNNGECNAYNTTASLTTSNLYVTIVNNTLNIGTISSSASDITSFSINIASTAVMGSVADFTYTVTSGSYSDTKNFSLIIGLVDEDWESGDFSKFTWSNSGSKLWTISSIQPYEGLYSAKSGSIGNNQSSTLSITMTITANDTISFYKKVSSEDDYDFLEFYVDGSLKGSWSGEIDWSREAYYVTAGVRTFKWVYSKDVYYSTGNDCAWIDYILFPPIYNAATSVNRIIDITDNNNFNVYPNPVNKYLNIEYIVDNDGNEIIELFNSIGQKVMNISEGSVQKGKYNKTIDISQYNSGIYFCRANINGKIFTKKIKKIKSINNIK